MKVQSFHKNSAIENFQYFFVGTSGNWSKQRNDVTNNTSIFDV